MRPFFLIPVLAIMAAAPLAAQSVLPGVSVPRVGKILDPVTQQLEKSLEDTTRAADRLARQRLRGIDRLVRRNPDLIERDARGEPARRGELLAMDVDVAALRAVAGLGFELIDTEELPELGLTVSRLRTPEMLTLAQAEELLERNLPNVTVAADNLHFQSGASTPSVVAMGAASAVSANAVAVGMIDGAPGDAVSVNAVRGFAEGAPVASNHGSAIAHLLKATGVHSIFAADVYGTDKAGGNALAIAKGLSWLVGKGSKVVTISLVGPSNHVLERAIAAAQSKGIVVVAAVGNDGPAAPPAYPASYANVVAVTAVDGKKRALIEAGRALHLDYAAPGADITALNARGRRIKLRGTSFATPLAAARIAAALSDGKNWRQALDGEAIDLGKEGVDAVFGRGLVCESCPGN